MTNRSASRSTEIVTAALEISAQVSVKSTLAEKSKRVLDASAPCSRKLSSKIVRTAASCDKSRASDPRTTWRSSSSCREATVDVSSGKTTRGVHDENPRCNRIVRFCPQHGGINLRLRQRRSQPGHGRARLLPARAALHAWPRPEMARQASALVKVRF